MSAQLPSPSLPRDREPSAVPLLDLVRRGGRWLSQNLLQVAVNAAIGFLIGWLVNVYLLADRYDGYNISDAQAPVTGQGSLAHGMIVWTLGSSLLFALFGYWRSVGTRRFLGAVAGLPLSIGRLLGRDGRGARVHLLSGAAVSFIGSLLISPWISGLLAVGALAMAPSVLGRAVANLLSRAYRALMPRLLPRRELGQDVALSMTVSLLGMTGALMIATLVPSVPVKIALALLCAAGAFLLDRSDRGSLPGAAIFLAAVATALLYTLAQAEVAWADDGGKAENGGSWGSWLRSGQAGAVFGWGAAGGLGAGFGSIFGTIAGNTLAGLPAAPAPPPAAPAAASATPAAPPMVTDTRVVSGQEAIDKLKDAGMKPHPTRPACLDAATMPQNVRGVKGIAWSPNPDNAICPDDVVIATEWRHPASEPVEQWLGGDPEAGRPDPARLADDLNRMGIPHDVIRDPAGNPVGVRIDDPNVPEHIRDIGFGTETIRVPLPGGGSEEVTVIGTPVVVTHWPATTPAPPAPTPPAPTPVQPDDAGDDRAEGAPPSPPDTPAPAGEPDGDAVPDQPVPTDEGALPDDTGPGADGEEEGEPAKGAPEGPLPAPEPGERPGTPIDVDRVDTDRLRDIMRDVMDIYNDQYAPERAVLQGILDKFGIPPELRPPQVDPDNLTDEFIRDALRGVSQERVGQGIARARDNMGLAGVVLNQDEIGRLEEALDAAQQTLGIDPEMAKLPPPSPADEESSGGMLDALLGAGLDALGGDEAPAETDGEQDWRGAEAGAAGREETSLVPPASTEPDEGETTTGAAADEAAGEGPAAGYDQARAADTVLNRFGDHIPDERMAAIANTPAAVVADDELRQALGTAPRSAHTESVVMRDEATGAPEIILVSQSAADQGTVLHETVHLASNPAFEQALGGPLNEAATEYFTRQNLDPGVNRDYIHYHARGGTELMQEMVDLVGGETVERAFFGGGPEEVEALRQAVNARTRPGAFDLIRRMTDHDYPDYDVAQSVLDGTFPWDAE